ncbi:hypothetical protein AcW1_002611 [Taiwanofungus camphoratus]|nr:hypothetical protein AcV7_002137 [Antrodia cinnamomea]KAI0943454.1 hypothetical protein AcW1_002611 [Antrodia cinnamomea]
MPTRSKHFGPSAPTKRRPSKTEAKAVTPNSLKIIQSQRKKEVSTGDGDAYNDEEEEVDEDDASLHGDVLADDSDNRTTRPGKRKRTSLMHSSVKAKSKPRAPTKTNSPKKNSKREESDEEFEDEDEDEASLHSDALDDEDDYGAGAKRKRSSQSRSPVKAKSKASPKKSSPRKKRKTESEEDDDDLDLKEGQEVVGVVVQAPKTGQVPPGQISRNTFEFLSQLKKPECNDREWCRDALRLDLVHILIIPSPLRFKLHEPVYRLAEKEWKDFVEVFTDLLVDVDPQIPHLPPKDVIHRIYRDIRFSNDKTPYKRGFSASFSRGGRKSIFAHYHISLFTLYSAIIPGGQSLIGAGSWCPGKNELATIRTNIMRSSSRLRQVISAPDFVKFFGKPKPHPKGERQSIFGMEDELKTAPKGVEKTHKDIDLLKCRSFCVVHRFMDSEVLAPNFKESLCEVVRVMQPFVHCMNDLMTIQDADSDSDDGGASDDEAD